MTLCPPLISSPLITQSIISVGHCLFAVKPKVGWEKTCEKQTRVMQISLETGGGKGEEEEESVKVWVDLGVDTFDWNRGSTWWLIWIFPPTGTRTHTQRLVTIRTWDMERDDDEQRTQCACSSKCHQEDVKPKSREIIYKMCHRLTCWDRRRQKGGEGTSYQCALRPKTCVLSPHGWLGRRHWEREKHTHKFQHSQLLISLVCLAYSIERIEIDFRFICKLT